MNCKRSLATRGGAMIVAGAMILIVAGCHHKSADDFLAEGDADMQATKLSDAEIGLPGGGETRAQRPAGAYRAGQSLRSSSISPATRKSSS